MKRSIIMALMAAAIFTTGCENFKQFWDSQGGEITKQVVKGALRVTTYLVASNNPALAPVIQGISGVLMDIDASVTPDNVEALVAVGVSGLVDEYELTAQESAIVQSVTEEAIRIYTQAYKSYGGDMVPDSDMKVLLEQLAEAINQGVLMVGTTEPMSAPPLQVKLSSGATVIIE